MRELIKGVTKIRWTGKDNPDVRYSLWEHREGAYIGTIDGTLRWKSPEGVDFIYCDKVNLWDDSDHEFVDEDESPKLKVGDLDMTYNIVPSDADESSVWSANHYDKYYYLTPEDIAEGKIRLDAYTVAKVWKIGSKDDSGALFHTFKLFPRWGEKNTVEREIVALYNQAKALARVYNVKLEDK